METRCLHHFYHNVTSCFISENDQFCNQSKHNYFEQSLNGNLWKGPKPWNGFSSNSIDLFFSFWSFGFMWKESSDVNTTRTRVHRKSFVIFRNEIIFPKRLRTFYFLLFHTAVVSFYFTIFVLGATYRCTASTRSPRRSSRSRFTLKSKESSDTFCSWPGVKGEHINFVT